MESSERKERMQKLVEVHDMTEEVHKRLVSLVKGRKKDKFAMLTAEIRIMLRDEMIEILEDAFGVVDDDD